MKVTVLWHHAALATFYRLFMHSATLVDRAVLRLAERGEGDLRRVAPYHRLAAGFHDVILVIDAGTLAINVLHIYRARR